MLYGTRIVNTLEKADGSGGEGIRKKPAESSYWGVGGGVGGRKDHMTSYTDLHAYIYGVQALGY